MNYLKSYNPDDAEEISLLVSELFEMGCYDISSVLFWGGFLLRTSIRHGYAITSRPMVITQPCRN